MTIFDPVKALQPGNFSFSRLWTHFIRPLGEVLNIQPLPEHEHKFKVRYFRNVQIEQTRNWMFCLIKLGAKFEATQPASEHYGQTTLDLSSLVNKSKESFPADFPTPINTSRDELFAYLDYHKISLYRYLSESWGRAYVAPTQLPLSYTNLSVYDFDLTITNTHTYHITPQKYRQQGIGETLLDRCVEVALGEIKPFNSQPVRELANATNPKRLNMIATYSHRLELVRYFLFLIMKDLARVNQTPVALRPIKVPVPDETVGKTAYIKQVASQFPSVVNIDYYDDSMVSSNLYLPLDAYALANQYHIRAHVIQDKTGEIEQTLSYNHQQPAITTNTIEIEQAFQQASSLPQLSLYKIPSDPNVVIVEYETDKDIQLLLQNTGLPLYQIESINPKDQLHHNPDVQHLVRAYYVSQMELVENKKYAFFYTPTAITLLQKKQTTLL